MKNPAAQRAAKILFATTLSLAAAGFIPGCQCQRKADPPAIVPLTSAPAALALPEKEAALEADSQRRFQELDRAVQRMQERANQIDEPFRAQWGSAMETLQKAKEKTAAELPQMKQREAQRALDELDMLREDAEAYFKEKS